MLLSLGIPSRLKISSIAFMSILIPGEINMSSVLEFPLQIASKPDQNERDCFEKNLEKHSSNKLCEIIAAFRYLGVMRREAILSMEELSKRRAAGSDFGYENEISRLIGNLPKIDLNLSDIFKKFKFPL